MHQSIRSKVSPREAGRVQTRALWDALFIALAVAVFAIVLFLSARSVNQVFHDPAQLTDPPIMQPLENDHGPAQFVATPVDHTEK